MRAECLSFADVPGAARMFLDFLAGADGARAFYPKNLTIGNPKKAVHPLPPVDIGKVADILVRQNRKLEASAETLANIERLRAGAAAVVTGQQVTLFGGTLLSFLKALTAIKVAEQTTQAGNAAVPIFWLATEDHDLPEVSMVHLLNAKHELRTARIAPHSPPDAQVGSLKLGDSVGDARASLIDALGENEITALLAETYTPDNTFGGAFGRLFAKLFGGFGLILIDNSDPELHQLAQPVFAAAASRSDDLNARLLARNHELEEAGYHAQVKVTKNSTLLFADQNGARTAVQRVNGQFAIGEARIDRAELVATAQRTPERFSANALLRPAVQDFLLPTITYIGGPAEVAYFAQAQVVYEHLLGRVTPIQPRASVTVVEAKIENLLGKYGLRVGDALVREAELRERIAKQSLPEDLQDSFRAARLASNNCQQPLADALRKLDPTLVDAFETAFRKIQHQLNRLERRAAAAEVRRNDEIARHSARISNSLFPLGQLQEREIAGVYFLARYGRSFLRELYDAITPGCPDHQVLYPGS
jgi:bacillithiol synthase